MNHLLETPASEKTFEWQLSVAHQWLRIDNDHVIEAYYAQPGAKGISINTNHGQVFIDFDKLQTSNAALQVQRLSFLPQGQTEPVGWYFRDDLLWREYGSQGSGMASSSISSADVERHFALNPRGTLTFSVGSINYSLDFSTMSQANLTTGLRRDVRRRPKFTSNSGGLSSTSDGGYKWEVMGDEGKWTEYQAHICSVDSAAVERQYQQNQQGQLRFNIQPYSYTLDFSSMCQVNNEIGTKRAVRRTVDDRTQQNSSSGKPRWQYQDIGGTWEDYIKGQCSVSSQDIELQFQQNPSATMIFTTKDFMYELNFSAMTQKNMSTNTSRSVRRLNQ
ncbi:uncharacterized protein [Brachyistius frenatus]|uniref:uncharacterized protein n=1 Tax=Brachyistius frenatus TaxID=100188 RepID=UPI0037E83688